MNRACFFFLSLVFSSNLFAQSTISAVVIQVENGKAYLDVTAGKAKVGDVFSIKEDAGYMIHPVTKEKIKREGEIMADLEIVETHAEYSVATIYPETAIDKIKPGMKAEMPEVAETTPEQSRNDSEQIVLPAPNDNSYEDVLLAKISAQNESFSNQKNDSDPHYPVSVSLNSVALEYTFHTNKDYFKIRPAQPSRMTNGDLNNWMKSYMTKGKKVNEHVASIIDCLNKNIDDETWDYLSKTNRVVRCNIYSKNKKTKYGTVINPNNWHRR